MLYVLAEFKSQDANLMQLAQEHKQWLKTFMQEVFMPASEKQSSKSEALLTLFEGLIVRVEFGGIEFISLKAIKIIFVYALTHC